MPDNVTVAIRCRPFNKREKNLKSPGCVSIVDGKTFAWKGAMEVHTSLVLTMYTGITRNKSKYSAT